MVGPRLKLLIVAALLALAFAHLPFGAAAPPEPVPPTGEAIFLPPLPASPDSEDPAKPDEPKSVNPNATQTPPPAATPPNSAVGNLLNQPVPSNASDSNTPPPISTQPMGANVDAPISQESSLFGQLSKAQERASQSAAPSASGVDAAGQGSVSAVETTELVRDSSGAISIARARRSAVSMQPVIRGYQQSQIYAQYQGANFVPARADFDSILSNIDPGVINNLIIIPGPYGVKYGPGLSFIDIVATPTPRYAIPEFHSQTNVLAQSNGQQLYGREMFFGGGPDYGFRFSVGQKTGNDYRSGNNTSIPASYNVRDIDLAVGFDLNPITKLELEYLTQDMTNTEFAGLIFDARFRKTDALTARLTIDEPGSIHWLAEAWFNRTSYSGDNLNPSKQFFYRNTDPFNSKPDPPALPPLPYPHVSFIGFSTGQTTNSGFRVAPTWGESGDVQVTAGIDFHYVAQQIDEFDKFDNADVAITPGFYDNYPVPPAKSYDPGAYWEFKAPVADDLTVTAGARVDLVTSNADGRHRAVAPDGTIPRIANVDGVTKSSFEEILGGTFSRRDVLLAGFVSADFRLTEELQLRAGFGHGERAPNATERYTYFPYLTVVQTPGNYPSGNPNLKPEKSNQFDLALVGEYDEVRFQCSGFVSIIQDYISFELSQFPDDLLPPVYDYLRFANTNATLAGAEASGEIDLTENWSPFFNLSFVEGRDQVRHEPLPSIYPFQSRMGIRWHDPSRKQYGVELSARVVAAQYHVSTRLSEPRTSGFTTFDLRGYWQFNKHLKLNGGIENITNLNYLEALSVHNPAVFEPGTNFFLGMQLDY